MSEPGCGTPRRPLAVRLLWMAAIWAASVLTALAVTGGLRLLLAP